MDFGLLLCRVGVLSEAPYASEILPTGLLTNVDSDDRAQLLCSPGCPFFSFSFCQIRPPDWSQPPRPGAVSRGEQVQFPRDSSGLRTPS